MKKELLYLKKKLEESNVTFKASIFKKLEKEAEVLDLLNEYLKESIDRKFDFLYFISEMPLRKYDKVIKYFKEVGRND